MPRRLRPGGHWITVFLVSAVVALSLASAIGMWTPGIRVEDDMSPLQDCWCYEITPGVQAKTCVTTDAKEGETFEEQLARHDSNVRAALILKPAVACDCGE